jgi:endonuclease/exonuclease/phosphatase family metal-dependent hydrolase
VVRGEVLILVTFNVQRARRPDRVIDLPRLASACAALGADVLALQEVTADQPPVVADACAMQHVFGPAIPGYGNALLSRGPLDDVAIVDLPFSDGREPRSAIIARTLGVTIAATHLGLRGEARPQLPIVLRALLDRPGPHALLGDLNIEDPDVAPLELVAPQRTFPAHAPRRRIDHIATGGLVVRSVAVLDEPPVGDHRPLAVTAEEQER